MTLAILALLTGLPVLQEKAPEVRVKRTLEEYAGMVEANLFSPPKPAAGAPAPTAPKEERKPEGPKAHMLSVTGFVFNEQDQRFEAVIEDREWSEREQKYAVKEIRFCKAGDEMAGGRVEEVTAELLRHRKGEKATELKAGDQIAADGSTSQRSPSHDLPPPPVVDAKAKEDALQRLKSSLNRKPPEETPEEGPMRRRRRN